MSDPTPEQVRASIVPNSDQLNADDLLTGPVTVTIEKVRKGDREQPIHIDLAEYKGKSYRPCKTMRRVLIAVFSDDPKNWIGQKMTLFCDPDVMWAGVKVGGIRISHLSGLTHPRTFMLTVGRGKRSEVTIHLLPSGEAPPALTPDEQEFVKITTEAIGLADGKALAAIGAQLKGEPAAVRKALRPVYAARKTEVEQG
jgi:hypothetical protein